MAHSADYANPERRLETAAALRNLVGEALALCLAADPQLGAELARLLKMDRESAAIGACHEQHPVAALCTCFRMLSYAQVEAYETIELFHWAERLELCMEQVAERLHPAVLSGSAAPRLHS